MLVKAIRPYSALNYSPPAPEAWLPERPDPASAIAGLRPDRALRITRD
jgi:hypothetical protein